MTAGSLPRLAQWHQPAAGNEKYLLRCPQCGSGQRPDKFNFTCSGHEGLLRSSYSAKQLHLRDLPGLWRFYDWLPVIKISGSSAKTVTYRSRGLAARLGLKNLFIAFNGYWPERGAFVKTCTFKEFEAVASIQYARDNHVEAPLVVASAGNTANAFAYAASTEHFPVVIVVPKRCLCDVWVPELDPVHVKTVVVNNGDYADAINVAKRLAAINGFVFEGGAANIARRDGLASAFLDAAVRIGALPNHYFQAIGSGTGAIAAWEAAFRLADDGGFGRRLPKFHLSQNLPFVPMVSAWSNRRRQLVPDDFPNLANVLDLVAAKVLTNRYPPYAVAGGVFDALTATDGVMYGVSNDEAREAAKIFEEDEGNDILPAAAVAVASLIKSVSTGGVGSADTVVLNITGGGRRRFEADSPLFEIKPDLAVDREVTDEELKWSLPLKLKKR